MFKLDLFFGGLLNETFYRFYDGYINSQDVLLFLKCILKLLNI